ncbi:pyruvate kinase [Actinoplanes couchii]|uniref:Pyruvate kinase n=1 Tax=Actinoplanes couchii TaxID=403638 RepID=A0ABQ3XSC8_9ACTN|nr:pyruvate kinase [Actinoplanes couchii]MDR6315928.1 pyruvate kinase [Actinoplanes couchii]GID61422.1 hypothetical protein Aco03nite_098260 [Actinoplanes couchii]
MTRVLATVKPGSSPADDEAKLTGLLDRGVTAIRVNLGRRDPAENLALLRRAGDRPTRPPVLFADLPGIKGRIGDVDPSPLPVRPGSVLEFGWPGPAGHRRIRLEMPEGVAPPAVGDVLVLDDGRVRMRVDGVDAVGLRCRVLQGEGIPRNTGVVVAAPGGPQGVLTIRDRRLASLVGAHVDYLCLSFTDSVEMAGPLPSRRGVIAKIETPRGVEALDAIAPACDGVMLARGDLAAFLDEDDMYRVATRMTAVARDSGTIVVFASNFFRGLLTSPYRLTDAEQRALDWVAKLRPDYLMLNETGFSPRWAEITEAAVSFCQGWD